jgi:DNA-binding CsgD family transcriptional regulator
MRIALYENEDPLIAPYAAAVPVGRGSRSPQLLERAAETAALAAALADARAGQGNVVMLSGAAGIGKTALAEQAARAAKQDGMRVLSARGGELEGSFAYGVVRQLLEPLVRTADERRQAALFADAAAAAQPAVLGPVSEEVAGVEPLSVRHGLYWLIANLAAERPTVLVLDDVHWADRPSIEALLHLARRMDGLSLVLLVAIREGEPTPSEELIAALADLPGTLVQRPSPLSNDGVAQLLQVEFGRAPAPGFVAATQGATGGNPLLVRELAATARADAIEPTDAAAADLAHVAPAGVAHATLTRLGRLSPGYVAIARAVAVLERQATVGRIAELAGLDEPTTLGALDGLVAAGVMAAGSRLEFHHPVVRRAIYEELAPGARSIAHRKVAELLLAEGADPEASAAHLLLTEPAGSVEVVASLRDAAAHALAVGAPDNAATYLERALEERIERRLRGAVMLELAHAEKLARRPTSMEHFDEAARLVGDPRTEAMTLVEQAEMLGYFGEFERSLEMLERALAAVDPGDPIAIRAEALRGVMIAHDPQSIELFTRQLPRMRELADSGAAPEVAMLLASWSAARGLPARDVLARFEQGWQDGAVLGRPGANEAIPQGITSLVLTEQLDRAEEVTAKMHAIARRVGSVFLELSASGHEAWIAAERGDIGRAVVSLRQSLELTQELGLVFGTTAVLAYGADILLERPDAADLAALCESITAGAPEGTVAWAMFVAVRGRLRAAAGRSDGIGDLRYAGSVADALGFRMPGTFVDWRSSLALMLSVEDRDEALELAEAQLRIAEEVGSVRVRGISLRTLGMLSDDPRLGRQRLEQAVAVLADSPARLEYARALVELGSWLRRARRRADAREPLRLGLDLAQRCGAVRLLERARTELQATGARPRRDALTGRDALTPSEARVAQLAAEGLTSRQIAQSLFVTTKTVETHLAHCYGKLGIHSRTELAEALQPALDAVVD